MSKNNGIVVSRLIFLFILFFSSSSYAQLHERVLPGESGSGLIGKLRLEFRPSRVLSYKEARIEMYSKIYNVEDSVECVYSGYKIHLLPSSPNPIGDLSMGGSIWGINCEHTFPQSKGAGEGNARSDMHHLFPARARVNEARLNYQFKEIDDRTTDTWYYRRNVLTQIPSSNIDEYCERGFLAFEPRESHKGNVARAMFYFYTIYREVADASFFGDQRKTLCEWHYADPVDTLEWDRNKQIAAWQSGKRNPFILDCSLAARTYCPDIAADCNIVSVADRLGAIREIYPNPSKDILTITYEGLSQPFIWKITQSNGQEFSSGNGNFAQQSLSINVSDMPSGMYHLQFISSKSGKQLGRASFLKGE